MRPGRGIELLRRFSFLLAYIIVVASWLHVGGGQKQEKGDVARESREMNFHCSVH